MSSVNDRWAFAGVPLNTDSVRVQKVDGWLSVPPLRGTDHTVMGREGMRYGQKKFGPRRMALGLDLLDPSADPGLLFQHCLALSKVFAAGGQQVLTHYRGDGKTVTAQAEVVGWQPADISVVGRVFAGVADFNLADPWFYGPQATLLNDQKIIAEPVPHWVHYSMWVAGSTAAGPWTVHNDGDVRGSKIVLTIAGGGGSSTQPFFTITNETNGTSVTFNGILQPSDSLVLDCDAHTAVLNGTTNAIASVSHSGLEGAWLSLEPGDNVLAASFGLAPVGSDGIFIVQFTPPYL